MSGCKGRWKIGVILVLLAAWVTGCATLNPGPRRENFMPLFLYSEDEEKGGTRTEILGPLFLFARNEEKTERAFRPFFYYQKHENGETLFEYLYPLGKYIETDRKVESYLMPLISTHQDKTEPRGAKERTYGLIFWGETAKGESYGGFFPFYGKLKKRFGKDEIDFFLWPLYSHSREGENHSYTVLWPFFDYSEGGGREARKLWPIFGQDRKERSYERSYFLWPFFHFEKRYLYTDDPMEIEMILPFYVSFQSQREGRRSVLWPFFNYSYNERTHYTQWDLPWPLFRWAEGDQLQIRRFFPIYGQKKMKDRETGFFLWPLYSYDHQFGGDYQKSVERFLLLSKDERQLWKKQGEEAFRFRLWPLFRHQQDRQGQEAFSLPALIPFDDEGFERNWGPLLSLYTYHRTSRGDSESRILWGTYLHRRNAQRELTEISFLLTYFEAREVVYLCLLRGLLEYRARGPDRALRFLYLPWPVTWREANPAMKP
jgi:hypothetical protein